MKTVRVALRIGYFGDRFKGSQYQPDVTTVQGEIEAALHRLNWGRERAHPLEMSSRTDAGVSARANLGVFDLPANVWADIGAKGVVLAINDQLGEGVAVAAACHVEDGVRIRGAHGRGYLYRLQGMRAWPDGGVDVATFARWCALFEGEHDFTNFSRPEPSRSPIRLIYRCRPWVDHSGKVIGFSVEGESFVWNQVRRIASALCRLASGEASEAEVRQALDEPAQPIDLGLAPSKWLVLWNVDHRSIAIGESEMRVPDIDAGTPPAGRARKLWEASAQREQETMLLAEWLESIIEGAN